MTRKQQDIPTDILGSAAPGTRRLVVIARGESRTFDLPPRGSLLVGRGEEADLRIDDASVSRRHARLHLSPHLAIEDLGSSNGTRVGGAPLAKGAAPVLVGPGTLVELGSVLVALQTAAEAPSGTHAAAVANPNRKADPIVASPSMRRVIEVLDVAAKSRLSVLLLGETGVGKEVLAARVHERSPRASRPFLRINCAALVETLLEAELFGYERGAFTGATQAKAGLLEAAHEGTVFLDEIGEMPLATQAKLLRVLESGEVTPVGSVKPRIVDVRFVAATNRDLRALVQHTRFREDLFFRLDGVSVHVPPLRERTEEIEPIAIAFLERAAAELGKPALTFAPGAIARLRSHAWPGNVRELKNVVQRAALFSNGTVVEADAIRFGGMAEPAQGAGASLSDPTLPPPARVPADMQPAGERERIIAALNEVGGNQTKAAERLGISRRTLINRMIALDVPRPRKA